MIKIDIYDLLNAGVHFGHITKKRNPNMKPYILMKKNGIHILDLMKTKRKIQEACIALKKIILNKKKILFVCTKKQGKNIIEYYAKKINMPYISERWLGGFLTNFYTIKKSINKMNYILKKKNDGFYNNFSKKDRLYIDRLIIKLEKNLSSVSIMKKIPDAILIVDTQKENIAVKEAKKLKIPIFGILDTDSDPKYIDYPIPANDDSYKSIKLIISYLIKYIEKIKYNNNNKDNKIMNNTDKNNNDKRIKNDKIIN